MSLVVLVGPIGYEKFLEEDKEGRGWGYSFAACHSHLTIDHAPLFRRSTNSTPNRNTPSTWAQLPLFQRGRERSAGVHAFYRRRKRPPLWEPFSPVPGPDASSFQVPIKKKRWEQKVSTANIWTAEGHRKIHQHASCAQRKCQPGAVRLVFSREGRTGSGLL